MTTINLKDLEIENDPKENDCIVLKDISTKV